MLPVSERGVRRPQVLQLQGETPAGLEASLGSPGGGIAGWLAGATVGEDGELASIAGIQTTVRLRLLCWSATSHLKLATSCSVLWCSCCLETSMLRLMRQFLKTRALVLAGNGLCSCTLLSLTACLSR